MSFDSITNRGEFFSNHYLDAVIVGDLGDLRRQWDDAEAHHKDTVRSRLKGLGKKFFPARANAAEASGGARPEAVKALNDVVLAALGFTLQRMNLELSHTTTDVFEVPVAARVETGSGLHLVALDAGLADDIEDLFDTSDDAQVTLLDPPFRSSDNRYVRCPADAVGELFAADDPPRWALVVAGRIVLLAERSKWAEGRFLAVDLDSALERNDTKKAGELETIASLFSTDALVPGEGPAVVDELVEKSHKHAVGVSKDLREGIRQSIEILATEVIDQRLELSRRRHEARYAGEQVDPTELTRQCLRYLYRLLVLLYAESRPELGIVPVNDDVYLGGYSLDRLRELVLVELDTDDARKGSHLDESLRNLFGLVNDGNHAEHAVQALFASEHADLDDSTEDYLQLPGVDALLFDPASTALLDGVTLRNAALQQVLRLLMLSPERKGKGKKADRGFISYAQLGINQLGAVYEGLMAYTGFFAKDDLYEVAKSGDPSGGTWVVPVTKAEEFPDDVFVTRTDPLTGKDERVFHPGGSFVFRLSGRDRQRSASYYTPEVLTRCVVKHALAELLGLDDYAPENGSSGITEASQILDLTICEPALGSGAFLNEAITQLAAVYLRRRQEELGETLDPERYQRELQKVKAHFALHQCYGVDLNATAVELAEVSLWLNCMHPGLKAPWFGLQLRRGNSLIGCRRATWPTSALKDKPWAKTSKDKLQPPVDRALAEPLGDELHHFLLPGHGWTAVADRAEAKEFRPKRAKGLRDWRAAMLKAPGAGDAARLRALAEAVEARWAAAASRIALVQQGLRRSIDVWGAEVAPVAKSISRDLAVQILGNPDSDLGRLRTAMDAWVGLWFWELDADAALPTWNEWLTVLEELLIPDAPTGTSGQLDMFADLPALLEADKRRAGQTTVAEVRGRNPWLGAALDLAQREGAWHWDLEFAPVFRRGGFDLQIGNPPWVRPEFDDALVLAEVRPSVVLAGADAVPESEPEIRLILREAAALSASSVIISSPIRPGGFPNAGSNLYRSFIILCWSNTNRSGVQGLLHPDAHLYDVKSEAIRYAAYHRLARLFQFINQLKLFEDVGNTRPFSVAIYRQPSSRIQFLRISQLVHPSTGDESFNDAGSAPAPSTRTHDGEAWDIRPHKSRISKVDYDFLRGCSSLLGGADDPASARLVNLLLDDEARAMIALAGVTRMGREHYALGTGMSETSAAAESGSTARVVDNLACQILQSPHYSVSNPFAQQTQPVYANHRSYERLDLESLVSASRRVRYGTRSAPLESAGGFCILYKRWCDPSGERTLEPALFPSAVGHVESTYGIRVDPLRKTALITALWSGIPCDYIVKVLGNDNIRADVVDVLPAPVDSVLSTPAILRAMRLNALTPDYSECWSALYEDAWVSDSWTLPHATGPLGDVGAGWTTGSALRRDVDRRQALIEIDALSALMLGLTGEQLCAMYRTQFPVLRKYEYSMVFDAEGRKICKHHQAAGYRQAQLQERAKAGDLPAAWKSMWALVQQEVDEPGSVDWLGHYTPPFYRPDREAEMTVAYHEFQRRLDAGLYEPTA